MDQQVVAFATFAISSQVVLIAFFAARRWFRSYAQRYGWIAYGYGGLGLAVGVWEYAAGGSWRLFVGPALFAVWAAYGAWVDLRRGISWRPTVAGLAAKEPIRWDVLGPYLTLYFVAQMFMWWPLWDYWRPGWVLYLILFLVNTALNLAGHLGPASRSSAHVE